MKIFRLVERTKEDKEQQEQQERTAQPQQGGSQEGQEQESQTQQGEGGSQEGQEQESQAQQGEGGSQEGQEQESQTQQGEEASQEGQEQASQAQQGEGGSQEEEEQANQVQQGEGANQEGQEQASQAQQGEGGSQEEEEQANQVQQGEGGSQEGQEQESQTQQREGGSQEGQEQEEKTEQGKSDKSDSEETKNYDAKKAFKEMLKHDVKQEGTSKGGGLELGNISNDFSNGEIPDSVINVLIEKFLNKTFIAKDTDLNARRESLTPTVGDIKWDIPNLIRHKTTMQYNQMLHDKYGFTKENGKEEKIPLSFYFDLSGSMRNYSRELALMALKLLKKDVKVLIGFNEYVSYQINSIPKQFDVEDLAKIFGDYDNINRQKNIDIQEIENKPINEYLREKEAKRVAIFSDFDPKEEVEDLSEYCEIYWFCVEERKAYKNTSLSKFKGHFYSMHSIKDFIQHLRNINNRYYEHLQRNRWEGVEK